MITMTISGETITEVKAKVFEALGITEPVQMRFPLVNTETFTDTEEVVEVEATAKTETATKKKRTRRTREQMENDAITPLADEVEETTSISVAEIKAETKSTENTATIEDCKTALAKVMAAKSTQDAVDILKTFGVRKVPELNPTQFSKFVTTCEASL